MRSQPRAAPAGAALAGGAAAWLAPPGSHGADRAPQGLRSPQSSARPPRPKNGLKSRGVLEMPFVPGSMVLAMTRIARDHTNEK